MRERWGQVTGTGNLHPVRYEDLKQNPLESLLTIVDFLGITADEDRVRSAIANNSVQKMREKEDKLYSQLDYASVARRPQRGVEPGGRFVRSAMIAGLQSKLTVEQLTMIDKHTQEVLSLNLRINGEVESVMAYQGNFGGALRRTVLTQTRRGSLAAKGLPSPTAVFTRFDAIST